MASEAREHCSDIGERPAGHARRLKLHGTIDIRSGRFGSRKPLIETRELLMTRTFGSFYLLAVCIA